MKKKIFTLLCLCTLCIGSAWGTDFTLTSNKSVTQDGITISFAQAKGSSAPAWFSAGLRLYANNTVTISCDNNITNITFNWEKQGSKDFASATANQGNYSHPSTTGEGIWTGSAKSVTFTLSGTGQLQLNTLSVTAGASTACTVQFDGNGHGTPSSASVTEASAGDGITLPNCTPETGYNFKGWATTADATTADVGLAGAKYYPSSNCTLFAVYKALYTISIEKPENGTLAVMNGDVPVESGSSVEEGTNLTIVATPSEGYKFKNWQYKKEGDSWNTKTANFDYTITSNVSFRANFEEKKKYTINYMINGVNTEAQEKVYEGTPLVFPTVKAYGGKVFAGWSTSEITTPTDSKPEFVKTAGLIANADITYYAVFVKEDKDLQNMTSTMNFSNETYTDWTVDTKITRTENEGTGGTGDYAGKINTNNTYITFNNKVKVTSFGFSFKRTSSNANYKVYIETSTDNVNWTSHQTYNMSDFGNGSYTSKTDDTFDGETELYVRFHCYNTTAIRYVDDVVINYKNEKITYSGYSTTVLPRSFKKTISDRKMATLYLDYVVTIPTDVKAYTATDNGDHTSITLEKITDGVIPANTGVIVYSDVAKGYEFVETTVPGSTYNNNCLKGVLEKTVYDEVEGYDESSNNYYALMAGEGMALVFKLVGAGSYAANSAYLVLPKSNVAKVDFTFDDEPTGIKDIQDTKMNVQGSIYNLNGVRVNENYNGIVIMNGKKYINK